MRVVLLGPPASGKGTQGRALARHTQQTYLSTGALLREAVENQTEIGQTAEPILQRGEYVSDPLMCSILADWLQRNDSEKGWVLDGFPRTMPQAQFLDNWLGERQLRLHAAISLDVPFEELLSRVSGRVECPVCRWSGQRSDLTRSNRCPQCDGPAHSRKDDDPENFRSRYQEYERFTVPVVTYYREEGILIKVSASAPKPAVTKEILRQITQPTS